MIPILHPIRACLLIGLLIGLQSHFAEAQTQSLSESGSSNSSGPKTGQPLNLPTGFTQESFRDDRGEHRYLLFTPSDYTPDKKWPVVLFLHGAGEKGTDGILPIAAGLGTALSENPHQKFLAVFPQNENIRGRHLTSWLADSQESQRALNILAQVEAKYSVDTSQRVLAGWSMGGYGAWSLAAANPNHWARVLALSGGEVEPPLALSKLAESKIPVWAIHGDEDALIPFGHSVELVERLNAQGGNGTATIVEGVGHDVWRYAFANQNLMQWLAGAKSSQPVESLQLDSLEPLPARSHFYVEQFTQLEVLPDTISLRMGNDALEVVAQGISEVIPSTALSGKLDDIERQFSSGGETIEVKLSNIEFECNVVGSELKGISGGRFLTRFELNPLRLKIGNTSLKAGAVSASTGAFHIDLGHRRPVLLEVEIQPNVNGAGLELTPLRQRFSIEDNNWHITPPTEVKVHGGDYSEANIVTGVVGGLYLQKAQIEKAVLGVVPSLMKVVEEGLKSRETPRLARLLWPLPVLVPDMSIAPSQVRTDKNGLSLVFDMQVRTGLAAHSQNESASTVQPFAVAEMSSSRKLNFGLALSAINSLGYFAIQDGLAYVNVQDLPSEQLADLAESKVLHRLFPDDVKLDDTDWNVGLRLIESFKIQSVPQENRPGEILIEIEIPHARLEAARLNSQEGLSIDFSLKQQIQLTTLKTDGIPRALVVTWLPNPEVKAQRKNKNRTAQYDEFETTFKTAWSEWTQSQSGAERPIPQMKFGSSALTLESFLIQNQIAELTFGPISGEKSVKASAVASE